MEKEQEPEPPEEVYLQQYQHRKRLRDPNFLKAQSNSDHKPRSAQIKVIQKFIGRLKSDNKNYEAILAQMDTLNLSKYLEQISTLMAVCANERDLRFFSQVATRLNLDYEDYPPMLLKDLTKQFSLAYQSSEDNKGRLKSLLLFTTQLFVCGFPFPYRDISEMLKKLVKAGTKKKTNFTTEKQLRLFAYYYNCDIYAAFLRHFGTIFTTAQPRWMEDLEKEGKKFPQYSLMIPAKTRQDFTKIFFTNYINSCISVLQSAFERIKELEEELRQNLRMSGEFNKAVESNYNELKQKFIFTKKQLEDIVYSVSSPVVLNKYQEQLVQVEDIMKKYINKVENVQVFQNEFERELYTELPELSKAENKTAGEEEYKEFKEKLDSCKNKNQSDDAIKAFEGINNKKTRKMLAKDILEYRKQYQLVTPYLCRIAAVVGQAYRDLTDWLLEAVFAEYEKLRESVNMTFVINDKKSRNLKYICQFTKFKIVDPDRTLTVIQNLVEDLKGYNIELLISTLESVGRFLYLAPQHANKFTFLLSKLENVMKQKSLPLFTTSQLINSINLLKPHIYVPKDEELPLTETQKQAAAILELDIIDDIDRIISGIEKLIKTEEGLEAVKEKMLIQIEKYDFLGNYHYAYLINELNQKGISNWIVDQTIRKLEDSVCTGNFQNCLLWSRFLGELYKYELIKRSFLFEEIKRFLALGKGQIGVINLVCTVLETCQGYLDSKRVTSRNQKFLMLVQFKKYIHRCQYVPMLEQFKIIDVLDQLEPNLTTIKPDVLASFLAEVDSKKTNKEVDLSKELDDYLEKFALKQTKKAQQEPPKDFRQMSKEPEPEENSEEKTNEALSSESDAFNHEFLNTMNSHIKDLSGKIAKPAFVEKVFEKKKDRKKINEGEQKRTVIGRCGNKFIKKEVIYQEKDKNGQKQQ